jgi:Cu2+-exporting ATPase
MNQHEHHHHHSPERRAFDQHAGHHTQDFLRKFWVSLILTVPVLIYSDFSKRILGLSAPVFPGSRYVPLVLSSIVFFYGGWVFISGAVRELKARLPGMMTLIGLAISVAFLYSIFATVTGQGQDLFWELTTLIVIMLLGHWMEMKAVQGTQSALKEISKLLPDTAEKVSGNKTKIVPLSELNVQDVVLARPGARIPADGRVIEGISDVDESLATGESKPVTKKIGSEVLAGTINGEGSLKIKVEKIGENTFLAGVMRLVAEAEASKSRLQILSDRAAFYLTLVAVASGIATFIVWIFKTDFNFALQRTVAVLVITCPHALGLAIPLVASVSTMLAARHGFLVRQRIALEAARNVDFVLFDKTGTLTQGEFGVTDVIPDSSGDLILQMAAGVESLSEHYIGRAIVKEAQNRGLKIPAAADFRAIKGKGVEGVVRGARVVAGTDVLLGEMKITVPDRLKTEVSALAGQGKTLVFVAADNKLLGVIAMADVIRKESFEAVRKLKKMGVRVAMITGDSEKVAVSVAKELNIDEYFARVLPREKSSRVKLLQEKGFKVAVVGDGINDAPALAQADLGIAIGAGTNVAVESAGIILVKNDPRDMVRIIRLSRLTFNKMLQNLFWATGYNVVAMPLAAGVLASKGILLSPALGAVFMSLSTVIVAVNAVLLRRARL